MTSSMTEKHKRKKPRRAGQGWSNFTSDDRPYPNFPGLIMLRPIALVLSIDFNLTKKAAQVKSCYSSMITPFSRGWYLQWYLYVPFFLKVNLYFSPWLRLSEESNEPSSDSIVWSLSSSLIQVTVSPALMWISLGSYLRSLMWTVPFSSFFLSAANAMPPQRSSTRMKGQRIMTHLTD